MYSALLRKSLTVCVLAIFLSAASSCSSKASHVSTPPDSWEWVGIANPVSAAVSSGNRNHIFGANAEEATTIAELPPVYYPSLQRLGEGYVTPDVDQLVVFDSHLNKKSLRPISGLGLPTQSLGAGSAHATTALFIFNESDGDNPYARRIVLVTEDSTSVVTRNNRPVATRACDGGSAVWIERDEDDGSELTLVRMNINGSLSQSPLNGPSGTSASYSFSALGCGEETSYISFLDSSDKASVFSVGGISTTQTLEYEGVIEGLPNPGINRSERYIEGSVHFFSEQGTIVDVDLAHRVITETEPLIGSDRRPVSATVDGEKIYIVSQPLNGAEELRVHSFSFGSPAADKEGARIPKLSRLMRGPARGAYTIPMSIYPYQPTHPITAKAMF